MGKPNDVKSLSRVRRVNDLLGDLMKDVRTKGLTDALQSLAPTVGVIFDAAQEVSGIVRFALRVKELVDPGDLGKRAEALAHTAYNAALMAELIERRPVAGAAFAASAKATLGAETWDADFFEGFGLTTARTHPFLSRADGLTERTLRALGMTEPSITATLIGIHALFERIVRETLEDSTAAAKFGPHLNMLKSGVPERTWAARLGRHIEFQRAMYESAPMSKDEPFAVSEILVEPTVSVSRWSRVRRGRADGHAMPLVDAFADWLLKDDHRNPALLHSVAGAGKSTATQRLFVSLEKQGLAPIRVLLRDLDPDRGLFDAIESAISLREGEDCRGMLRGGEIFEPTVSFYGRQIVPHVLILDGWDELTIGTSGALQTSIETLLRKVRTDLCGRFNPVPVLITGRPNPALRQSRFLDDDSLALELRPFDGMALRDFVDRLRDAGLRAETRWRVPAPKVLAPVFEAFDSEQARLKRDRDARSGESADHDRYRIRESGEEVRASLYEILSLPLLAHLAIRVLAETDDAPLDLFENPTRLYRRLIDVTCPNAGRLTNDMAGRNDRAYVKGEELRLLLRKTAAALGAGRDEHLEREVLKSRLEALEPGLWQELDRAEPDSTIASLVVSYYFKTGNPRLGVEFLHKSFREYLFAEEIVVLIEAAGSDLAELVPEDMASGDNGRTAYRDRLQALAQDLARRLAASWLSPEAWTFLRDLIQIRVEEARVERDAGFPVAWNAWQAARSGMFHIWMEWLAASYQEPHHERDLLPSLAGVLDWLGTPHLARLLYRDAHIGDGLYGITAETYFAMASADGWLDSDILGPGERARLRWTQRGEDWDDPTERGRIVQGEKAWQVFVPGAEEVWRTACARIDAAPGRSGPFPSGHRNRGVDLRGESITLPFQMNPPSLSLDYANLSHAELSGGVLNLQRTIHDLVGEKMVVHTTSIHECTFEGGYLPGANFYRCHLVSVHFRNVDLRGAQLRFARLHTCVFEDTDLTGASFEQATLVACVFRNCRMEGVTPPASALECAGVPSDWPAP